MTFEPSQTISEPMFSSAILRTASNTVSSAPTVITYGPFRRVIAGQLLSSGECPFEDVAPIALVRVLVLSLTLSSKVSPFEISADAASGENAFRGGLVTWVNDPHPLDAAVDSVAIGPFRASVL